MKIEGGDLAIFIFGMILLGIIICASVWTIDERQTFADNDTKCWADCNDLGYSDHKYGKDYNSSCICAGEKQSKKIW